MKKVYKGVFILLAVLTLIIFFSIQNIIRREIFLSLHFTHIGKNKFGFKEYKHDDTGIIFILLPKTETKIGSSIQDKDKLTQYAHSPSPAGCGYSQTDKKLIQDWLQTEMPQRLVTLDTFMISKFEISRRQWAFFENSGSEFKNLSDLPKTMTWFEAKAFCQNYGFELPTEAQWEYACRAGSTSMFSFGDAVDKTYANFENKYVDINELLPNDFGLHNMHGNVAEWCIDDYVKNPIQHTGINPTNPSVLLNDNKASKVVRGGARMDSTWCARSAVRMLFEPHESGESIGLRPVIVFD